MSRFTGRGVYIHPSPDPTIEEKRPRTAIQKMPKGAGGLFSYSRTCAAQPVLAPWLLQTPNTSLAIPGCALATLASLTD
jgi:hypothetical protein